MISMRKKTIGEVLRLSRINQGLSLEELQRATDIQISLLEALEADDFDKLPSTFYARSFLRKYAWAEEVDVDEIELSGRRRTNRKKRTLLPLFYFILFSVSILTFVIYYVWSYIQTQPGTPSTGSYSLVNSTTTSTTSKLSGHDQTTTTAPSTSEANSVTISGEGDTILVTYKTSKDVAELQLSVSDTTSWISVSDTDLVGGVTLSPNNKLAKTTISKDTPVTITLGVVKGVTLKIDNQEIDTSKLTSQTGWITLTLSSN